MLHCRVERASERPVDGAPHPALVDWTLFDLTVMQKRRIQAVNRPIEEEMLQRDFETFVDAARSRMAERKPSQLQLKIRGLIQQDWNDYMGGFDFIKNNLAGRTCLVSELAHYKGMVRDHEALAVTKLGA